MKRSFALNDKINYPDPASRLVIRPEKRVDYASRKDPQQLFHEDIEIKYIVSGTLNMLVNDVLYTLNEGDILIVNPYEFHANTLIEGQMCVYHLIEVHPDYFALHGSGSLDLRAETEKMHRRFVTVIRNDDMLGSLLALLVEEHKEHGASDLLLEVFFLRLLRSHAKQADDQTDGLAAFGTFSLIEPALRMIHLRYGQTYSVGELAASCGLSASHFSHVFKAVMGKPPIAYSTDYRVKIADRLLESTDAKEAAELCGFHDMNYFYRCYKKVFGIPLSARCRGKKDARPQ